ATPYLPEALEKYLADEPGFVAEQLVDGGDRGRRFLGDLARGEAGHAVLGQHSDRHLQDAIAQRRCALLRSWHKREPGSRSARGCAAQVGIDPCPDGLQCMLPRTQL